MSDVVITAGSVVQVSGTTKTGTAGETITAGQALYLKSSDNRLWKADADDTAATAACVGIALNGGAAGQPIVYQATGDITIGGTVVQGTIYLVSDTAGGIRPVADVDAEDYVSILGIAVSASVLRLMLQNTGIQTPA